MRVQAWLLAILLLGGCKEEKKNLSGEYIYRCSDEYCFTWRAPQRLTRAAYPWEEKYRGAYPKITKEFFYCRGNFLNPPRLQRREGREPLCFRDCHGGHGLPLRGDREFIYPCLLEILNYIQEVTEKRVVITTGHRCPIHNAYCDSSRYNWGSKHMIGAEVDFYVEGMEALEVIGVVRSYYEKTFPFADDEEFVTFKEYTRPGLNVVTPPLYNKEIFLKLYLADEGRDGDNGHDYPYVGIQVRYDRESGERVSFTQEQAQNYLRQ